MKKKKLPPSAQKLYDKLMELSNTTKTKPKLVKSTDVWQFTEKERRKDDGTDESSSRS